MAGLGAKLLGGLAKTSGAAGGVFNIWPPGAEAHTQKAFQFTPNRIPSLHEIILLLRTDQIQLAEALETAAKNGFDAHWLDGLFKATTTLLSATDYVSAERRGIINSATRDKQLEKLGYDPKEIPTLLKITEFFPGPQDLIRFVVREAYDTGFRAANSEADKPPGKFLEEAKKAGLPEEQARNYWFTHWELPSINQGYEMLHRGEIDATELKRLLQAKDIMPSWIDRLMKISYSPLTRVDVRRMYRVGVLDRTAVHKAYKDIGYNDENAELLTQFTERFERAEGAGLTRNAVQKAYVDGILTEDDFRVFLRNLEIAPEVIEFYLAQSNLEKAKAELKELEAELSASYRAGQIDLNTVRIRLSAAEATPAFIDTVVNRLTKAESQRVKLPARTDLDRWFEKGIISEDYYFQQLIRLGFSAEHARYFMSEAIEEAGSHKRKFLDIKTYQGWFKKGIMDENTFRATAKEMKLSDGDVNLLIQSARQ